MPEAAAESPPDWISAHKAHELVRERNCDPDAAFVIAKRAHSGLVCARASLFIWERDAGRGAKEEVREEGADLPSDFWWAEGHEALEQNWTTGDFSTWIERTYRWQAFGVEFRRDDIKALLATAPPDAAVVSQPDMETAAVETPAACPLPTDDEIKAKMIDLYNKGVDRDVAAKIIREFPGFEGVGNELARRVVGGSLPLGRPEKRHDK